MKIARPDLAALGVCVVIVVCMTVCELLRVGTPGVFPTLATIALSAGVGIATLGPTSSPEAGPATPVAAEPAPAAAVTIPAPAPAPVAESAPAVATHAP